MVGIKRFTFNFTHLRYVQALHVTERARHMMTQLPIFMSKLCQDLVQINNLQPNWAIELKLLTQDQKKLGWSQVGRLGLPELQLYS